MTNGPNKLAWFLTKSYIFLLKPTYTYLIAKQAHFPYRLIWRLRMPLKIEAFVWLVVKNRALTKEQPGKVGSERTKDGELCCSVESIYHLFFARSVARFL